MNYVIPAYRIFPLGDTAITVDFGNVIDEKINDVIIRLFNQISHDPLPGMIEAVPAYSSITIYYDVFGISKTLNDDQSVYDLISKRLREVLNQPLKEAATETRLVKIPVCYEKEFAPDIEELALQKKLTIGDVIKIHTSKSYRVYMLGFLPGFSYMGEVDDRISMARKAKPQPVAAGSIGIAGKQTGIYPMTSPGGWQIIGRTPLKIFEASDSPFCLLHPGDEVQFISISKNEFENY